MLVVILILWYAAHAFLSRFVGTCTMGDTDRFVTGLILGAPAALVAVVLVLRQPPRSPLRDGSAIATFVLGPAILYLYTPLAFSTSLAGHHLCGLGFDEYLSPADSWKRAIPLVHVALVSVLLATALRNWARAARASQCAERVE
jgi:hypothetical protein